MQIIAVFATCVCLPNVTVIGSAAADAERASDWLMRMNDAAQAQSYRGIFVLRNDDQLETMQIVHDADIDGVRERILSLNGEPREIIRDQKQVWCYLPNAGQGVHQQSTTDPERRFPGLLPDKISVLEDNYDILVGEEDRVANRPVRRIDVIPRDMHRFGHMFWIDTEFGLILKADRIDKSGNVLEQYQFVKIEYVDEISDFDMMPYTPKDKLEWHSPNTSDGLRAVVSDTNDWSSTDRPDGFEQIDYSRERVSDGGDVTHHLVYSDGLATVSVFVEPLNEEQILQGPNSMGTMSAFGVVTDSNQITAMGEVPMATLERFATSTRPK